MTYATVIYYCRYSSSKQHGGTSIERQIHLCDEYRLHHKLPSPSHIYTDKGASAFHSKQLEQDLGQLLDDLKSDTYRKPVLVLCEALDRISRASIRASQNIMNDLTSHADVVTVSDGKTYTYEDDSLETVLIQLVKAATANEESEKKSKRAKAYWKKCREEGKAQNTVCPRYLTLNPDRKSYTVKPDVAEEIKGIYQLLIAGYGIKRVHQHYQSWSPSSIARLRKDERVVEYGIVNETDFWKVNSHLISAKKSGAKNSKNLFRSLLKCGGCGANLVFIAPRPSRPTWSGQLVCKNRQAKGRAACPTSKNINYNKFEPIFLDFLENFSSELFKSNQAEVEQKKSQLEKLSMEIDKKENTINNLLDEFSESIGKRLKARVETLEAELDKLDATKERLEADIRGYTDLELKHPKTDAEREEFNTTLLHSLKEMTVFYPDETNSWFNLSNVIEISPDYKEWEPILHAKDDDTSTELEFDTEE
ncbi:recombinase family protein [Photobacterium halotolerans]|uniref:Resolvase/invertase-type recombinase catalytic domain-containing protein n=1 Tax=Photobacterium halotolerans TaxID=265726 RepID=A0A0F5VIT0_9GAMM|nr:recombinase family protein [Photobacterium halotolerans]KKD01415.1 hypothetical protein KY46_00875 [Photobacterium halotolerans]